ncbi:hypothetical protein FQN55_005291 [Onygenales sp. PD_40]|nr:hypothetical protein FQN55_005291 [Onygenales sp. PD_40]
MVFEASYNHSRHLRDGEGDGDADEGVFWGELDAIFLTPCDSHAAIDNVLRAYLDLTTRHKDSLLHSEYEIARCSERLLGSDLFAANAEYIRRQIIYCLLQDDAPDVLYVAASFLLFDGRHNEHTFEMMNKEGVFVRLLELIQSPQQFDGDGGAGLHRLLMNLMYEMCRIQRVRIGDLVLVDDDFVKHLFGIIEELSDDVDDPYHYPVIRVLLVLNEQFMVSAHDPLPERSSSVPPTNKVIKVLSMFGSAYKTFGENIILLLNRESETSLQLLTLKLLYLLFTTPPTYEYFYTNDLRVLVDILIRNLLDLPEEAAALRHTYLRVLYPLLAHTQLRHPPHYKREEIKKLLGILVRGQFSNDAEEREKILHFDDVDETTKRLVLRCGQVDWLVDGDEPKQAQRQSQESNITDTNVEESINEASTPTTTSTSPEPVSPRKPAKRRSSQAISPIDPKQAEVVGMNLEPARSSSVSVLEVASHKEKPGVMVPSRKDAAKPPPPPPAKQKPEPPKARRWRGRRGQEEDETTAQKSCDAEASAVSGLSTATVERDPSATRKASEPPPTLRLPTPPTDSITATTTTTPTPQTTIHEQTKLTVPKIRTQHSSPTGSPHAPALPPPRRSSHSVPPPSHLEHHHHHPRHPPPPPHHHHPHSPSPHLAPIPATTPNGHVVQKPEPPVARRSRARRIQPKPPPNSNGNGNVDGSEPGGDGQGNGHGHGHVAQQPPIEEEMGGSGSEGAAAAAGVGCVNGAQDEMGKMRIAEG